MRTGSAPGVDQQPETQQEPVPARADTPPGYLSERGRDLRIDFLRGYFVFAMVVDHVRGPSWLYAITGGNHFYTSAAEGFIFVSGLVAGLVYRRLIQRDGLGPSLRRVIQRAGQLYLLAVGLTLIFVPLSETLDLPWSQGVDMSNSVGFIVSAFTLHRTYYLVDVPLLYALLFLITPLALVLLSQGRTTVLVGMSILIWGAYQLFPEHADFSWPIAGNYLFNLSAWQLLFFAGLAIGYHRDRVGTFLVRLPRRLTLFVLTLGLSALIGLNFIVDVGVRLVSSDAASRAALHLQVQLLMLDVLFGKADLRPGRLLASAIVFGLLFLALTMFWQPLRRALGWLLLPLGQHALYAYTAHVAVTAAVALFLKPLDLPQLSQPGLNAVLQVVSVLLIWSLVRFKVLVPTQSTMRWWSLSPLPIALVLAVILPRDPSPTHPGMGPEPDQPAPERARVARAFGTPIPRTGPGPPPPPALRAAPATPTGPATGVTPGPAATPMPLPPPLAARRSPQGGEPAVSEYVGPIEGALRRFAFYSPALNADMEYFIYLPPDYGRAGRRYPVLYMLHGAAGDKDEWVAEGLIDAADRATASAELRPMLIVLPDGDMSYWVNHTRGGARWGDYLAEDLVRHIDASYRTLPEPSARAVGGLSMGAWGALHQGLTRSDVFGTVGAHSPALRDKQDLRAFLGDDEEFARKDPLSLVRTAESIEDLQIWIDLGEEDPWLDRTELLHDALTDREIRHEWHVLPGGHDGDYWRENTLNYLRFYEGALNPR